MENTILFDNYNDLTGEFDRVQTIPSLLNTNSDLVDYMFRDFKYPISSWPVIINDSLKEDLEEASAVLPRLLKKIPELYFENDLKRISDFYFNGDQTTGQFSLMCNEKGLDVSSRLDLTYTENGFKVLEINMGSSIGGMEFQNFAPLIEETHPNLATEKAKFTTRKTQSLYIEFLINKIEQHVSANDTELGIFIVNEQADESVGKKLVKDFFDKLLLPALNNRKKAGTTFVDGMAKLQFNNGELQYKGTRIHAVLVLDFALKNISPNVFRALLSDKVYFPDHLGTMFLRDKRNLGILRDLAAQGKFSDTENEQIFKYIPWTEVLGDREVIYEGVSQSLLTLLIEKREKFVIKIADGLQGQNVFIGKFSDSKEWKNIIETVKNDQNYVAQEFLQSVDLKAPNKENNWQPHKLVWGAFGFGETYGGAWVRMSANENDGGVINSATGAVEAIVYESLS